MAVRNTFRPLSTAGHFTAICRRRGEDPSSMAVPSTITRRGRGTAASRATNSGFIPRVPSYPGRDPKRAGIPVIGGPDRHPIPFLMGSLFQLERVQRAGEVQPPTARMGSRSCSARAWKDADGGARQGAGEHACAAAHADRRGKAGQLSNAVWLRQILAVWRSPALGRGRAEVPPQRAGA